MRTVFSHIVQKRFSRMYEDVATDALAYVLESSDAARRGMMKLLRTIVPDLPALYFRTQLAEGAVRPDMWGFAETEPRVFVENKFWAGLTDSQPVAYLKQLAASSQPAVLLVVAPAAREYTLWRELSRRLRDAGIAVAARDAVSGITQAVDTELGPVLALSSWTDVLSVLEHEAVDEPGTRGDLVQLRSLCDVADNDAFAPVCNMELSDQRTPAFILQLGTLVQATVDLAVAENVLSVTRLRPQASWDRIGRYVWISEEWRAGAWLGIHFALWKLHGATPLWLFFSDEEFGRAQDVRRLIEPWADRNGVLTATSDRDFAVAIDIPVGEEKAEAVHAIVAQLKAIALPLCALPSRTATDLVQEHDNEFPP